MPVLLAGLLGAPGSAGPATARTPPVPGNPYIVRYIPGEFPGDAYNYGITVDRSGAVLIANTAGVVRFAGGRWDLVTLPGRLEARAVAPSADGRVFVGSFDQFGVLADDPFGTVRYSGLESEFPHDDQSGSISEVFRVAVTRDGAYFVAYSEVFLVAPGGSRRHFDGGGRIVTAAQAGDRVVVQRERAPLAELTPAGFRDLVGPSDLGLDGPVFATAVPAADGAVLLLSRDRGWYRLEGGEVRRFPTQSDERLAKARCIRAVTLPDGGYAVGCESGDLFHLTADLEVGEMQHVSDLPLAGLAVDREGFLWVASEGEILRVALGRSWSVYDAALGVRGTVQAAVDLEDTTLIATTTGLYRSQDHQHGRLAFVPLITDRREITDLLPTPWGVLVATATGLELWDGHGLSTVIEDLGVWSLERGYDDDSTVYAIEDEKLAVLRHGENGWQVTTTTTGPSIGLSSAVQLGPGELWAAQIRGGLIRFELGAKGHEILRWSKVPLPGPDAATSSTWVFKLGGRLFARDADRYFVLDHDHFRPVQLGDGLPAALLGENNGDTLECPGGLSYAYSTTQLFARADPSVQWQELRPFEGAARRILGADCGADHTLLLESERGLLRFDPAAPRSSVGPLETRLRRAVVVRSRSADQLLELAAPGPIELAPFQRLRFDYEVPTGEADVRYRTRLVGFDDDWTPALPEAHREFTAMPPGRYRFESVALVRGAHDVRPATLEFSVRPRWYQTSIARLVAIALLGGSIAGLVRWRSAALVGANVALDALVRQRTNELLEANRRLEQQARQDDLTGLANRRRLEHFGATAFAECVAVDAPLSVLMVDADHFKVINDRLGHAAGDQRLREIAGVLRDHSDPNRELAARYGGEEFAVILPGVPLTVARTRAEEIRAQAEALTRGVTSTVSIGVAERVAHEATSIEHLLHLADAGLYRAKQQGRNQVALCPPDPAAEMPGSSSRSPTS